MKENLFNHLTSAASTHTALAKSCRAMSGHFSKLAECAKAANSEEDSNLSALCANVAAEFSNQCDAHTAHAESAVETAQYLQNNKKADNTDELNKIVPSSISGIAPPANGDTQSLHRAVTRPGAPAVATETATLEFSKIWGAD
jgi:hypothetical protein